MWYVLELVGERRRHEQQQQQQRRRREQGRGAPRHVTPTSLHTLTSNTALLTPGLHTPGNVTKGRSEHESSGQVRPETPRVPRASRRARTERVVEPGAAPPQATPCAPFPSRFAPRPCPAAAVTLRADHTPNNPTNYLLLGFICSCIGLMTIRLLYYRKCQGCRTKWRVSLELLTWIGNGGGKRWSCSAAIVIGSPVCGGSAEQVS